MSGEDYSDLLRRIAEAVEKIDSRLNVMSDRMRSTYFWIVVVVAIVAIVAIVLDNPSTRALIDNVSRLIPGGR